MNPDDNDLDDILDGLSVSNIPTPKQTSKTESFDDKEYKPNEQLMKTLDELDTLIASNFEILDEGKRIVQTTGEPEFFEVYTAMAKAQSDAIKAKLKLVTDKAKLKQNKELKGRDLDLKEKQVLHLLGQATDALPAGTTLNQTNILLTGSREEMYDMITKLQEAEKAKEEEKKEKTNEKPPIDI